MQILAYMNVPEATEEEIMRDEEISQKETLSRHLEKEIRNEIPNLHQRKGIPERRQDTENQHRQDASLRLVLIDLFLETEIRIRENRRILAKLDKEFPA